MRAWTIRVIALFVLAALAWGAFWTAPSTRARSGTSGITQPLADSIPLDDVDSIELSYADGREFVFQREGDRWTQVQPFSVGLDAFSIRQLVVLARGLERSGTTDGVALDDTLLGQLGLDPPAASITWRWNGGEQQLDLGNRTLAGRAWALAGDASAPWIVDSSLHERVFDQNPRLWRDGVLFRGAATETGVIEIEAGGEQLRLQRTERGWELTEPLATRADDSAVMDWLARLGRLRSGGAILDVPDDLVRYGLQPANARIAVFSRRNDTVERVLLGDPIGVGSPVRYGLLEASPAIIRIDEDAQRLLIPSATTFVDATGSGVFRADIGAIDVQRVDGSELRLKRDFDAWVLLGDDGTQSTIARNRVEQLLAQLTEARAGEIAFSGYPQEMEVARVVFYDFDNAPIDTVRIVREPNQGRWALENGDGVLRIFTTTFDPPLSFEPDTTQESLPAP